MNKFKYYLYKNKYKIGLCFGLFSLSVLIPILEIYLGLVTFLFMIGAVLASFLVVYSLVEIKVGVLILFIISFFIIRIGQMIPHIPFGIIIDVFIASLALGVLLKRWKGHDVGFQANIISIFIWIWLIYNLLEFFNPIASREAWFYVIRTIAIRTLFYFIILNAMDRISFLRLFIIFWISLSFIGALYGLFQEYHGLLESELTWLVSNEERFKLFFNWGRFRIFSFFSDPTVFGILMSFTGIFCLTIVNMKSMGLLQKIVLVSIAGIMFLSTVYTGTRTAYVMIPSGLLFYSLLTFQRKILIVTSILFVLATFIIYSDIKNLGPLLGANPLERVRSAFKPNEDPSYLIRKENQERIKPYIQSHPFGAGVGSIGVWGERFTPNSSLAGFAPDSTYVRIAVELGWIGLIIHCSFLAVVLIIGVRNHYRLENPDLKSFSASILAVIYSIVIANYPQQAVIQVPNIFIFYALIASIVRLPEYDRQLSKKLTNK